MAQLKEARYWEKLPDGRVHCKLCPHNCHIAEGKRGLCRVRKNEGGTLYSIIYGRITSASMDPIEKKPLYHFHPGSAILSLGTMGCNFACKFCQNYTIAQMEAPTRPMSPEEAVRAAGERESIGIAYTYNEPFIWYEYVYDTARLARDNGLKNVLVTNGYVQQQPLLDLLPCIDALNIDVKSMRPEFYKEICRGTMDPVLETCKTAARHALVEITNLVIPGYNDTDDDFEKLADWIADNLGRSTPVHLSAYFPCFKLKAEPTPISTLEHAFDVFAKRLDHVYIGNVASRRGADTLCRSCGALLIERRGYTTKILELNEDATCSRCAAVNNIVM